MKKLTLPAHVGIIMDGNGRWATARGLSRNAGHKKGADNFGDIVRYAMKLEIPYLTVYAFSTENWNRPAEEVEGIMSLLRNFLKDADKYRKENVRTFVLGSRERLAPDIVQMIAKVEEGSRANTGITVGIALNYGGRDELVAAARKAAEKLRDGEIATPEQIDEKLFERCLYTAPFPDVDLLIRTGGEKRISNFLLWKCAYAEFVFSDVWWPDFGPEELDKALVEYTARHRRMGGL